MLCNKSCLCYCSFQTTSTAPESEGYIFVVTLTEFRRRCGNQRRKKIHRKDFEIIIHISVFYIQTIIHILFAVFCKTYLRNESFILIFSKSSATICIKLKVFLVWLENKLAANSPTGSQTAHKLLFNCCFSIRALIEKHSFLSKCRWCATSQRTTITTTTQRKLRKMH